jgi:hypothetical protein
MAEGSKWELYAGIAVLSLGVLSVGLELFSLIVLGEHTEYFDGGWLAALELVFGTFLLARYRSDRFREVSSVIGESMYFKLALALLYLGFGILGAYIAAQAYFGMEEGGGDYYTRSGSCVRDHRVRYRRKDHPGHRSRLSSSGVF